MEGEEKMTNPSPNPRVGGGKKAFILDSGILINLSMNGFLYILEELKKATQVKFLITKEVKYEIIDKPLTIPRFELGALRIANVLKSNVMELPESLNISEEQIKSKTGELMEIANHSTKSRGKWIKIVSNAEMSWLALSSELTKKGVENMIGVDERTTRILSEKPQNLEKIMTRKLHKPVKIFPEKLDAFKQFRFIRSSELVYVAQKKDLLRIKDPKALEAVLYATKFKGSSISWDEIKELKNL